MSHHREKDRLRDRGNENFPVASILLPGRLRGHIIRFYRFARTADDIADNPALEEVEKLALIADMDRALQGGADLSAIAAASTLGEHVAAASLLGESLSKTNVDIVHARELLEAFRRDVLKPRTENWQDLMSYCRLSAAPVGRYLIALSGGVDGDERAQTATMVASDALCAALQVLNHLQDIKDDYQNLGRIYLPRDWLQAEGVKDEDLALNHCTPGLSRVVGRALERVDRLLVEARPLASGAGAIRSRALAREAGGIHMLASRLCERLKHNDPLARRVKLTRAESAFWFLLGWVRG